MKKSCLSVILLALILIFFGESSTLASEVVTETEDVLFDEIVKPVILTDVEKANLKNLGFSAEEIATMTDEEFKKQEALQGEIVVKDDNYYEFTTDNNDVTTAIEVTEKQAIERSSSTLTFTPLPPRTGTIDLYKPPTSVMGSATSPVNSKTWLKLTTTSSKLSNGNTLLKTSFVWLRDPNLKLTDVVGITHSASAVKIPNTTSFAYKYTDGKGVHTLGSKSTTTNISGIAKRFNLKAIGTNIPPTNHNGYISFQVKKGNKNDVSANAFGHYLHLTGGFTGATIGMTPGSMTLGWNAKYTRLAETLIVFKY